MSLRTDADTVGDLSRKISEFELAKAAANAPGATVVVSTILITQASGAQAIFDCSAALVGLSAAQKTALFALEAGWQASIKAISAAWTP